LSRALILLCVMLFAFIQPAMGRTFDSAYSRFDYERCETVASPEPGVVDMRRCPGHAAIAVIWTAEPDSSEVTFSADGAEEALGLGSFYEAGDTVEWRLRKRAGEVATIAAIVRYAYGQAVGRLDHSSLVVYRIEPSGRSCVMGMVDGARPNANAEARQLADRWGLDFVCGVSPRR